MDKSDVSQILEILTNGYSQLESYIRKYMIEGS